jgi:amino acid transporter
MTDGAQVNYVSIGLAMLLPVYTLLGWEGSADLAEETRDPRRTAPNAMFRSVIVSGIAAFFVYAVFAMAIPGDIANVVNQTDANPLISIFESHFGRNLALLLKIVAFLSIFSALLANVTVATRMCFSLARDKMLPGSSILGVVSPATRTPIYSVLLVGAVAILVNFLSQGIINNVVAITAVTYYGTYLFTMVAVLIGEGRGNIPAAPSGYLDLGGWLRPLAWIGILWSLIVIAYMTLPEVNHPALENTIYFELVGVAWFFLYLRSRLKSGQAGPPVQARQGFGQDERSILQESL